MKAIELSIEALKKQVESGKLKSNNAKILSLAKRGPITKYTAGLLHQTATSTCTKLQDMGLLEIREKKEINGEFCGVYYYQPDPEKQKANRTERLADSYERWKKAGRTRFKESIEKELAETGQMEFNFVTQ